MGINNSMNNGFSYDIALNFPEVKESENNMGYGDLRKIGTTHETESDNIIFVACYIHSGGYSKDKDGSFVNYDALEKCLSDVKEKYSNKKLASILMGVNKEDGNGNKNTILGIFNKILSDIDIVVFDYEHTGYKLKMFREIAAARKKLKDKDISKEEYVKLRSNIEWRRKNGILKEMPTDYIYTPKKDKGKLLFRGSKKQF